MRKTLTLLAVLALALGLLPPGVAQAAFPEPPLVLHELTPCTLFDTRPSQGGTGALAGGEARTFHVVGSTSDFAGQGGAAGGCGIPGFSGGSPQTEMVFLNLVAVDPSGGGNLRVWATDVLEPMGGVLNYQKLTPNLNNANALVVGVRKDSEGSDITIRANASGTHVRGVALGYLTRGEVSFWSLGGNAGTDPSVNFVGTTDDTALNFRVNDQRAFRLEPNSDSPNVIGGHSANEVSSGAVGATIGGGGGSGPNRVTDDFGTIGGGRNNQAGDNAGTSSDSLSSTVGGGQSNTASDDAATVGGGSSNTASGFSATVAGGDSNMASIQNATVGGGFGNVASGVAATVAGGSDNTASGFLATVAGGGGNDAIAQNATVGGGSFNTASSNRATVGGGDSNIASDSFATVSGGGFNTAGGSAATVAGGSQNTASGVQSTVPGGGLNTAAGAYSFATGRRAKANHDGAFVWADSQNEDMASSANSQFIARAQGGFFLQSDSTLDDQTGFLNTSTGAFLSTTGVWTNASDASLKTGFTPVEPGKVLERVADMPITSWSYRTEPGVLHIGPTAQDFQAAFGLGSDDETIGTVDADGVALAAIQGLHQENQDLKARVAELEASGPTGAPGPGGWHLAVMGLGLGALGLGLGRRWGRGGLLPA